MSGDDRVTWRGKVSDSAWFIACGAVLAVLAAIIEKWHGPSWFLLASGVIVAAGGVVVPAP